MPKIKFNRDLMDLIRLFDSTTGASTLDCVVIPDLGLEREDIPEEEKKRIIFMVGRQDLSKAIGKNGINVIKLKEKLRKNIDIIAYDKDLNKFIRNLLYPAKIIGIEEQKRNNKTIILVNVRTQDKGLAIGKNGRNINKANVFAKRHFDIDSVIIST
ncbi:MAG: NusA-like transcription termination signal-binding factor [archaeon]|nr:NusA-like transcription termination signal-binding factor [archaeon]